MLFAQKLICAHSKCSTSKPKFGIIQNIHFNKRISNHQIEATVSGSKCNRLDLFWNETFNNLWNFAENKILPIFDYTYTKGRIQHRFQVINDGIPLSTKYFNIKKAIIHFWPSIYLIHILSNWWNSYKFFKWVPRTPVLSYAKFMALMGKYLFITRLIAFENKCKFVDFSWFAYDEFPIAKQPIFALVNVIILKSRFSASKNIAYSIYFHFAKPNIGMCMLWSHYMQTQR